MKHNPELNFADLVPLIDEGIRYQKQSVRTKSDSAREKADLCLKTIESLALGTGLAGRLVSEAESQQWYMVLITCAALLGLIGKLIKKFRRKPPGDAGSNSGGKPFRTIKIRRGKSPCRKKPLCRGKPVRLRRRTGTHNRIGN